MMISKEKIIKIYQINLVKYTYRFTIQNFQVDLMVHISDENKRMRDVRIVEIKMKNDNDSEQTVKQPGF